MKLKVRILDPGAVPGTSTKFFTGVTQFRQGEEDKWTTYGSSSILKNSKLYNCK